MPLGCLACCAFGLRGYHSTEEAFLQWGMKDLLIPRKDWVKSWSEIVLVLIVAGGRPCGGDQRTEPVWRLCGRPLESFAPSYKLDFSCCRSPPSQPASQQKSAAAPDCTSKPPHPSRAATVGHRIVGSCGAPVARRSDQVCFSRKGSPEGSKTPLVRESRGADGPSGGVQGQSPCSPEAKPGAKDGLTGGGFSAML